MLASAERRGLARAHRVVAVDLGMTADDRDRIAQRFPWCSVRRFDPAPYPPHVGQLSTFAWKPIAIAEHASSADGFVLWFDSGTLFHGTLDRMIDAIGAFGIFSLAGQTPLGQCCDARTLDALGATADDRREPYRAGALFGFDPSRPVVRELIARWRECALDPSCIAPPGLDPRVHRFDQAILTALLCAARRTHALVLGSDEIDISSCDPVRWVSTRNKVPRWMPIAMDPAVRAYYAVWKRADRVVLRLKAWRRHRAGSYPRECRD